jgi:RHS repeat-associated protein
VRFLNEVATPMSVVLQQDDAEEGRLKETTHYLYGLGLLSEELVRALHQTQQFFYHSDGLGSTIALTDRSGRTQADYQYDVWGNLEKSFANVPNSFLFTGEEQDPETGLYYLRARWYDPRVARFLTKDPFVGVAELPRSVHPYIYVFNNPANLIDPLGIWGWPKVPNPVRAIKTAAGAAVRGVKAAGGVALGVAKEGGILAAKLVVTGVSCQAAPYTCGIALTLGFAGWLTDPDLSNIHVGWGAIEFTNNPAAGWLPGGRGAITLDGVILYKGEPDARARAHEYSHVWQSWFLGDAYVPAHLVFGGASELACGSWWRCNPLERVLVAAQPLTALRK